MENLELLADLLVDKREWLRKKAIFTLDENLPRMVVDQEKLAELIRLLRERVRRADQSVENDVNALIRVFESFLRNERRDTAPR